MLSLLRNRFNIIVAIDSKNGIGLNNAIPWLISEDLAFFKNKTTQIELPYSNDKNVLIMGRKTWDSIPENHKPLPNRHNLVVSSMPNYYNNLNSALEAGYKLLNGINNKIFVIGGEQIYKNALSNYSDQIDNVFITKINSDYNCDKFFPYDDMLKKFKLIATSNSTSVINKVDRSLVNITFEIYSKN